MVTAWPFTGAPRKYEVIASGAVPTSSTPIITAVCYLAKIRVINTSATDILTITLTDADGNMILDTTQLSPKGIYGELMDFAPYEGLTVIASGAGLEYLIYGWTGTGTL